MKRLFIDMDGTLAKFHDEPKYLEAMYEEDFFKNLKPFENMINGVKEFINMHPDVEVFVLSSSIDSKYCCAEKNKWMDHYLPEIPTERRLYPKVGSSKADFVKSVTGKAVTKSDFLLDDYNKGLYDWEEAGGTGIKCHNNINHKGLGLHGGQKGQCWTKDIVHTDDLPVMIASELSAHMDLHFDFKPIYEAYNFTGPEFIYSLVSKKINGEEVYAWDFKEAEGEFDWEECRKFNNPLDAIRCFQNKTPNWRDFNITEISHNTLLSCKTVYIPEHRFYALLENYCQERGLRSSVIVASSLNKFKEHICKTDNYRPNVPVSALETLPKPSLSNILKSAELNKPEPKKLIEPKETKLDRF